MVLWWRLVLEGLEECEWEMGEWEGFGVLGRKWEIC